MRTIILNHQEVIERIQRMAWQVYENNHNAEQIILVGISSKGYEVAKMLMEAFQKISKIPTVLGEVHIRKEDPKLENTTLNISTSVSNKPVVLVDDVLNSGRTLMYATIPILNQYPKKLMTAVLANRAHADYPIKGDIVGIELATTLSEHINFEKTTDGVMTVFLD